MGRGARTEGDGGEEERREVKGGRKRGERGRGEERGKERGKVGDGERESNEFHCYSRSHLLIRLVCRESTTEEVGYTLHPVT